MPAKRNTLPQKPTALGGGNVMVKNPASGHFPAKTKSTVIAATLPDNRQAAGNSPAIASATNRQPVAKPALGYGASQLYNRSQSNTPPNPVLPATSSQTVSWRSNSDNPATSVAPPPFMPGRAVWNPVRKDIGKTMLELQKMKQLSITQLGHDFRINENAMAAVPTAILPSEFGLGDASGGAPVGASVGGIAVTMPGVNVVPGIAADPSQSPGSDKPAMIGGQGGGTTPIMGVHPVVFGAATIAALVAFL